MKDRAPIFSVTIDAKGITLGRMEPQQRGYSQAVKDAVLRQRDAIELFRKLKSAGKSLNGVYCFHFLDSARTFAMLHLQGRAHEIQDNLDRVLDYDGAAKPRHR